MINPEVERQQMREIARAVLRRELSNEELDYLVAEKRKLEAATARGRSE